MHILNFKKKLQHKKNQKVTCNMLQLTFICVSYFGFILLPTGSPLMKLGQFWPLLPSPGKTKCYMNAKSSLQHSIHIFRKSQKKLATFPINFFRGITNVWEGGRIPPPRALNRVKEWVLECGMVHFQGFLEHLLDKSFPHDILCVRSLGLRPTLL